MKKIKEILASLGEEVGRGLTVNELEGKYKAKRVGTGPHGKWERGTITDETGSLEFFMPKKYIGEIPNGTEITILDGVAECGEYKDNIQYSINMRGAIIEMSLSEEILDPGRATHTTTEVKSAYPKPRPQATGTSIAGERIDSALFHAISAIEKHKDRIDLLIKEGRIKPIDLNALTATVIIDSKR